MNEVNGELMVKLTEAVTIPRAEYEALLLDRAMLERIRKLMRKEMRDKDANRIYGTSVTIRPIDIGLDEPAEEEEA